jgi:hypothetical protein
MPENRINGATEPDRVALGLAFARRRSPSPICLKVVLADPAIYAYVMQLSGTPCRRRAGVRRARKAPAMAGCSRRVSPRPNGNDITITEEDPRG